MNFAGQIHPRTIRKCTIYQFCIWAFRHTSWWAAEEVQSGPGQATKSMLSNRQLDSALTELSARDENRQQAAL